MINIAIVYHSGFGHTEVQARQIEEGAANVSGVQTELIRAEELTGQAEKLNSADAIIFGSPTYLGNVSGPFKSFMDSTSDIWFQQQWKDKIAAGFTNSHSIGGDKLSTLLFLTVFAAQHGMIWVGQAEMNTSPEHRQGHPEAINRSGTMLGAVASSENASPEITPPAGDLTTARLFGKRVAEITRRFN